MPFGLLFSGSILIKGFFKANPSKVKPSTMHCSFVSPREVVYFRLITRDLRKESLQIFMLTFIPTE